MVTATAMEPIATVGPVIKTASEGAGWLLMDYSSSTLLSQFPPVYFCWPVYPPTATSERTIL